MTDKKELDMTEHEKCIHYHICLVNNYIHKRCGYYVEEPKQGEWIDVDYGIGSADAECSECGERSELDAQDNGFGYDYSFPPFCKWCGARMKEGDEK